MRIDSARTAPHGQKGLLTAASEALVQALVPVALTFHLLLHRYHARCYYCPLQRFVSLSLSA
jgi:hypothetical protein